MNEYGKNDYFCFMYRNLKGAEILNFCPILSCKETTVS